MEACGFLLLDKPSGISSAKAINIVKKKLNITKIGHAGTLDPLATGLLVVLVGRATKLADYVTNGYKLYSGEILLGVTSDSDDICGQKTSTGKALPDFATIKKVASEFLGRQKQVPPNVSALKVEGKRAYALVRSGQQVKLAERPVEITQFDILEQSADSIRFLITCSKGTYIRAIARDLGEKLDCGGCIKSLRREGSLPFNVSQAKEPEHIEITDLIPWQNMFPELPRVTLGSELVRQFKQGNQQALNTFCFNSTQDLIVYQSEEDLMPVGLIKKDNNIWKIALNLQ